MDKLELLKNFIKEQTGQNVPKLNQTQEAGLSQIPRLAMPALLRAAMEDGVLNIQKLVKNLELKPGLKNFNENSRRTMDALGHSVLEKTGKAEKDYLAAVNELYPQFNVDNMIGSVTNPQMDKLAGPGVQAYHTSPGFKKGKEAFSDPSNPLIKYRDTLEQNPDTLTGILSHETGHALDDSMSLKGKSKPYNFKTADSKPIVAPSDIMTNVTKGHHILNPKNYELEKIKELADLGIVKPTAGDIAKIKEVSGLKSEKLIKEVESALSSGALNQDQLQKRFNLSPERYQELKALYIDNDIKKAAGGAPLMLNGEFSENENGSDIESKDVASRGLRGRELPKSAEESQAASRKKAVEIAMSGVEHLSRPGAAVRGGTRAAQTGDSIVEGIKSGFSDPANAPTGYDIVEGMGLPDDQVALKTAISTAVEFADPLDWAGIGGLGKLSKLKKLRGR